MYKQQKKNKRKAVVPNKPPLFVNTDKLVALLK